MNTDVRVAVCTNRAPEAAREALAALSRQCEPLVVISGCDTPDRAAYGPLVLAEPRPGLSHARNRALAWAREQGADVLAFVDDDAVAEPGWFDALRRRWNEAPPEVAWIGGPIRLRLDTAPPIWFSDGIAHVLTTLDRGPELREIVPEHEVVYGANISFRVAPLLDAGGFDPELGHSGRRVSFGEEDQAQRALGRLGYRGRYVPDASVDHVVPVERLTRRSFLRRRFAFGRVLGRRGGRDPGAAAGHALRFAASAVRDQLRGRSADAMVGGVRLAENAGVVVGWLGSRRGRRG